MKALIKTVLVTCLMLGGAAATQTASAGDLIIRIGNRVSSILSYGNDCICTTITPCTSAISGKDDISILTKSSWPIGNDYRWGRRLVYSDKVVC